MTNEKIDTLTAKIDKLNAQIEGMRSAFYGITKNGTRGLGTEDIEIRGSIADKVEELKKAKQERAELGYVEVVTWSQCLECGCFNCVCK